MTQLNICPSCFHYPSSHNELGECLVIVGRHLNTDVPIYCRCGRASSVPAEKEEYVDTKQE